jgi:DNA-binding GntR family transcriptional regulator
MPQVARARWMAVYAELRRRISHLELEPGAKLTEAEVAEEFGVSASPARDALGRLAQEGLVVIEANRGYRVASLTVGDIGDICDLRFSLEVGVARLAMDRTKPEDIVELRELSRLSGEEGLPPEELIRRNQAFHLAIAERVGGRRVAAAVQRVMEDSTRFFHLGLSALTEADMRVAHDRLLDAIEAHDMEAAIAICRSEAFGTSERVLKLLMRSPGRTEAGFLATTREASGSLSTRGAS